MLRQTGRGLTALARLGCRPVQRPFAVPDPRRKPTGRIRGYPIINRGRDFRIDPGPQVELNLSPLGDRFGVVEPVGKAGPPLVLGDLRRNQVGRPSLLVPE